VDNPKKDRVDLVIHNWKKSRPDLDPSAKGIIGRIIRLQGVILENVTRTFKKHGINPGEYAVLCTLRVNGPHLQMAPGEIMRAVLLTSGGMSNLLERMEKKKLIRRLQDPDDRRGVMVKLTEKGKQIIDAAMKDHVQVDKDLISSLDSGDCTKLEKLLKKLLVALDPV